MIYQKTFNNLPTACAHLNTASQTQYSKLVPQCRFVEEQNVISAKTSDVWLPSSLAKMFLQHSAESVWLFALFGADTMQSKQVCFFPHKLRCHILAPGHSAPPAHWHYFKGRKTGNLIVIDWYQLLLHQTIKYVDNVLSIIYNLTWEQRQGLWREHW